MRLRSRREAAGFRFERFSSSGIRLAPALDLHEVADLPEHTGEHRALLVLGRAADLAEAERAQRAAMPLALSDLTAGLGDLDLRHADGSSPRVSDTAGGAAGVAAGASDA